MECGPELKRNESSSHEKTWRNPKYILLSQRSQSEKATYYLIPTLWYFGKDKTMKTVKKISGCQVSVRREGWIHRQGMDDKRCETALYNTIMVDARYYMFLKIHKIGTSLMEELRSHMPHGQKTTSNIVTNSIKTLKMVHIQKKKKKAHGVYTTKVNPNINLGWIWCVNVGSSILATTLYELK